MELVWHDASDGRILSVDNVDACQTEITCHVNAFNESFLTTLDRECQITSILEALKISTLDLARVHHLDRVEDLKVAHDVRCVVSSSLGLGVSSNHKVFHKSELFLRTVESTKQNFVGLNELRPEVNNLINRVDRLKDLFLEDVTEATLGLALDVHLLGQKLLAYGAAVTDLVEGIVFDLLEGVLLAVAGHDTRDTANDNRVV